MSAVPDWVVRFLPSEWVDRVPEPIEEPSALVSDPRSFAAYRVWREAQKAWLAEHAPELTYRELQAERLRRFPVVERAAVAGQR